jgi:hypothetical protein
MMENEIKLCIKCKEAINPLRIKALPTTKTCVNCSTIGAKRGMPITFGEKDNTWTDMVIMEPEEYDKFKEAQPSIELEDIETIEDPEEAVKIEDEDDEDDMSIWDDTLLDGLEDL